jgi:hypothetical protein
MTGFLGKRPEELDRAQEQAIRPSVGFCLSQPNELAIHRLVATNEAVFMKVKDDCSFARQSPPIFYRPSKLLEPGISS